MNGLFKTIAPANYHYYSTFWVTKFKFMHNYKFNIAALRWFRQIKQFLPVPVSDNSFLPNAIKTCLLITILSPSPIFGCYAAA